MGRKGLMSVKEYEHKKKNIIELLFSTDPIKTYFALTIWNLFCTNRIKFILHRPYKILEW